MASSAEAGVLAGCTALVTGASGGIGRAVAARLRGAGAWVAMVARREGPLRAAAEEIGGHPIPADVTDAAAVHRLAEYLVELLGGVGPTLVVNAAGAFQLAPVAETDPEVFDEQVAVNLRAPFLLMRAFLPRMLARGSGHIVTIGSVAGRRAFPHNGAYAASKFGVRGLHAVLDVELRGTGVRATLIEAGATATPLWDRIDPGRHPDVPSPAAMLLPEAVADAVFYAVTQPPGVDVRSIVVERA